MEKGLKKCATILQGVKGEVLVTKFAHTSSSLLHPISSIPSSSSSHLAANPKLTLGLFPLLIASLISVSGDVHRFAYPWVSRYGANGYGYGPA